MNFAPLNEVNVVAKYDPNTHYIHVEYRQVSNPTVARAFYQWLYQLADSIGIEHVCGATIDFRKVNIFEQGNVKAAQQESLSANRTLDMSHIPVALVVETMLQEQMVRISSNLTKQTHRMRLVKSDKEALNFITEWNRQNKGIS